MRNEGISSKNTLKTCCGSVWLNTVESKGKVRQYWKLVFLYNSLKVENHLWCHTWKSNHTMAESEYVVSKEITSETKNSNTKRQTDENYRAELFF